MINLVGKLAYRHSYYKKIQGGDIGGKLHISEWIITCNSAKYLCFAGTDDTKEWGSMGQLDVIQHERCYFYMVSLENKRDTFLKEVISIMNTELNEIKDEIKWVEDLIKKNN